MIRSKNTCFVCWGLGWFCEIQHREFRQNFERTDKAVVHCRAHVLFDVLKIPSLSANQLLMRCTLHSVTVTYWWFFDREAYTSSSALRLLAADATINQLPREWIRDRTRVEFCCQIYNEWRCNKFRQSVNRRQCNLQCYCFHLQHMVWGDRLFGDTRDGNWKCKYAVWWPNKNHVVIIPVILSVLLTS